MLSQPSVQNAVREAEQQLNNHGRVLLRPSGTEPLIRVMVEGVDGQLVETVAHQLAEIVKTEVADKSATTSGS
jgi:phosphoglucosamine mutase